MSYKHIKLEKPNRIGNAFLNIISLDRIKTFTVSEVLITIAPLVGAGVIMEW